MTFSFPLYLLDIAKYNFQASKWCFWLNDAAASTEAAVSKVVRTEETTEETADGANSSVGKVEDKVKLDKHLKLMAMYQKIQL